MNNNHIINLTSEGQIYASFRNVHGAPQNYHNVMLDIFTKIRQYVTHTFL